MWTCETQENKRREEKRRTRKWRAEKATTFIIRGGRTEINCPECSQAIPFHPSDKDGLEIRQITGKWWRLDDGNCIADVCSRGKNFLWRLDYESSVWRAGCMMTLYETSETLKHVVFIKAWFCIIEKMVHIVATLFKGCFSHRWRNSW
jgi:hypothetical protein